MMKSALNKMITICYAGTMVFLVSCEHDQTQLKSEFMPDMYRSPSYETYSGNPVFADSITAQKPVTGSIPRGYTFFHYPNSLEGYEASGRDMLNPTENTAANLEEGKRLYGIYCMQCHGETGNGDGSLIATGKFPPPPSYSSGNSSRGGLMKDLTDGKIYHTITYGVNLMGSHASQVNPEERWKIIRYIHELQKGDGTQAPDTTAKGDSSTTSAATLVK